MAKSLFAIAFASNHGRAKPRGVTLVEALVAMAVFLIGFAGVLATGLAAARQVAAAGHRQQASDTATSLLDLARLLPPSDLAGLAGHTLSLDAAGRPTSDRNTGGLTYGVSFDVATTAAATGNQTAVTVNVAWAEPGQNTPSVTTLRGVMPGP